MSYYLSLTDYIGSYDADSHCSDSLRIILDRVLRHQPVPPEEALRDPAVIDYAVVYEAVK